MLPLRWFAPVCCPRGRWCCPRTPATSPRCRSCVSASRHPCCCPESPETSSDWRYIYRCLPFNIYGLSGNTMKINVWMKSFSSPKIFKCISFHYRVDKWNRSLNRFNINLYYTSNMDCHINVSHLSRLNLNTLLYWSLPFLYSPYHPQGSQLGSSLEEVLFPEYISQTQSQAQSGSEPLADAQLFEPVPYRSAVSQGATHVLVLRTRPDGVRATNRMGLPDKMIISRWRMRGWLTYWLTDCSVALFLWLLYILTLMQWYIKIILLLLYTCIVVGF